MPTGGALLVIGIIALVLLVRHENRAESPLIPLKLLRMPAIWHSDAMAACHGAALVSLITFIPVFLEVVREASPSETGLLLVPLTIGIGTGSLVTGRLVSRTGRTTIYPIGGLILATATLLLLAFWTSHLDNVTISILLLLNGLFMGTVMGVVQVTRAERRRLDAARRGGRLGAILAFDRRRLRHGAGRHRAVRFPVAAQSGSRARLCRHGRASRRRRSGNLRRAARAPFMPTSLPPSAPPSW